MHTYQKAQEVAQLLALQVKRGIDKVLFPPKCRGPAEDLIKKLCRHDPSQRLPMKTLGHSIA